ncbi:MAG: phospholipase A [Oceanococcus sp.]
MESDNTQQARRRQYELSARRNPYAITPHKPNYLLPLSWSHRPSGTPLGISDGTLNKFEVKFQLSFKVAVWEDPLSLPVDLYFAYTGRSFWQAYNSEQSSPFRDTNHEPEAFFSTHGDWLVGPIRDINLRLGFSHQSNGQALPLSRSWNRVYLGANGRWKRFFVDAVFWDRIPEDAKESVDDPEGDDNPGIERYIGNAELSLGWVIGDNKSIRINWRDNLRSDHRGALTTAFTYPINDRMKGYVEFFTGYGETLLDYNHSNERLSFGIALSDWP